MSDTSHANNIRAELLARLQATGLASLPGTLLYSGFSTVQPGPLYFLGYNPGGDAAVESDTIASRLQARGDETNEYLDTSWAPGGIARAAGQADLQRRACYFLKGLGLSPRSVCASNVVFARSTSLKTLGQGHVLAANCWPIHLHLLSIVQPRLIFVMGKDAYQFVRSRSDETHPEVMFPSGHDDWQCRATAIQLDGRRISLVSAPHFGRYAIDHHPDVVQWVHEIYLASDS